MSPYDLHFSNIYLLQQEIVFVNKKLTKMKKTLLIILMGCMTFYTSSQGKEGEFNLGFTTGDFKDVLGLEINAKGGYLWEVTPKFSLGPLIGVSWIFSKKDSGAAIFDDSFGYTISAAGRFDLSEILFLGGDLGYGGISAGGGSGGFYYRPVIGFKIGDLFSIIVSYASLSLDESEGRVEIRVDEGSTLSTIQIGLRIRK